VAARTRLAYQRCESIASGNSNYTRNTALRIKAVCQDSGAHGLSEIVAKEGLSQINLENRDIQAVRPSALLDGGHITTRCARIRVKAIEGRGIADLSHTKTHGLRANQVIRT
jgi:hypothetical protein